MSTSRKINGRIDMAIDAIKIIYSSAAFGLMAFLIMAPFAIANIAVKRPGNAFNAILQIAVNAFCLALGSLIVIVTSVYMTIFMSILMSQLWNSYYFSGVGDTLLTPLHYPYVLVERDCNITHIRNIIDPNDGLDAIHGQKPERLDVQGEHLLLDVGDGVTPRYLICNADDGTCRGFKSEVLMNEEALGFEVSHPRLMSAEEYRADYWKNSHVAKLQNLFYFAALLSALIGSMYIIYCINREFANT